LSLLEWLAISLVLGLLIGLGGWWLHGHGYADQVSTALFVLNWVIVVAVPAFAAWSLFSPERRTPGLGSLWLFWVLSAYRLYSYYTSGS
jgi:hypothetical protein